MLGFGAFYITDLTVYILSLKSLVFIAWNDIQSHDHHDIFRLFLIVELFDYDFIIMSCIHTIPHKPGQSILLQVKWNK